MINASKTKFLLVTHQKDENFDIMLNDIRIERVRSMKFLGIKIDEKITFKDHLNTLASKISRNIAVLYRISIYMPPNVLRLLYYTFIQSHLIFGISAWGACAPTNLARLARLQSRAAKLCVIDKESLNLKNLYRYSCLVKYMNDYFFSANEFNISYLLPSHSYQTRHRLNENLNAPLFLKTRCQQSFIFNAVKLWNELPSELRFPSSLTVFKYNFKFLLLLSQLT